MSCACPSSTVSALTVSSFKKEGHAWQENCLRKICKLVFGVLACLVDAYQKSMQHFLIINQVSRKVQ